METLQLKELLTRVEQGEGVQAIINSMGLNTHKTLADLQLNHRDAVNKAKQISLDNQNVNGVLHGV